MNTVTTTSSSVRKQSQRGDASPSKGDTGDETLRLMSIVANSSSKQEAYAGLIQWLSKNRGCVGCGIFASDAGELQLVAGNFSGPAFENPELELAIREAAASAAQAAKTQITRVKSVRNVALVAVPIAVNDREIGAIVGAIVTEPDKQPDDSFLLTAAAYAALWQSQQSHNDTRQSLAATAATLDLLRTLEAAETFRGATISMVNALREHLRINGIVLGLVKGPVQRCRVESISGLAEFDSSSSRMHLLEDALEECLIRERLTVAPSDDSQNRDTMLAHEKLRAELQVERLVSHPLKTGDGEVIGAWMAIEETCTLHSRQVTTLMRVAAPRVAEGLALARRADASLFGSRSKLKSRSRWLKAALIVAGAFTAIMFIPVPYRVHCECSAEPEVRRFIVAPNDGLIEKTLVEPGDVVSSGQVLARMDGRDVRWELAGLAAEKEKARKDHDTGLIDGDAANAQRAIFELKRIEAREHVLTRQRDQLELTSPIDGIVLDGHLDRVENAPVTTGQALYEVAPLSPVSVEVAITDEEYANVKQGYEVVVRFDGLSEEFMGTIDRIHPRSEVRDGDNVFIAEVNLANADETLHPGMSGYARIKSQTRSLGWNLFHKPWEHLRKSLPF